METPAAAPMGLASQSLLVRDDGGGLRHPFQYGGAGPTSASELKHWISRCLIFILVIFEIANSTNPFAKLKALERIDELSGIVTDAEAMKSRTGHEEPVHQPMFILPAGVEIAVTVIQRQSNLAVVGGDGRSGRHRQQVFTKRAKLVHGEYWNACSNRPIPAGARVRVIKVQPTNNRSRTAWTVAAVYDRRGDRKLPHCRRS